MAAILIVAVVAFVMALFGWRITYAPEMENSWDAVSAVATWAGVFASVFAIVFAIRVPKKIADRQDRIALFEKRYGAYSSLLTLQMFSHAIDKEFFNIDDKNRQEFINAVNSFSKKYAEKFEGELKI
mgnify:CR=1 FL=1